MNTATTLRFTGDTRVVGFALGVVVGIPAVMAAAASGGAGHGGYVAARALFPVPMLLTLLQGDSIGAFSIVVGLLQFPIYGLLLGWSIARRSWVPVVMILVIHMIAASACFAGILPNLS